MTSFGESNGGTDPCQPTSDDQEVQAEIWGAHLRLDLLVLK
jgi:hypothetical protein